MARRRSATRSCDIFSGFGFFESFRRDDETDPVSISFERMVEARFAIVGTVDQVREQIAELRDDFNPEWFGWYFDQGLMPQAGTARPITRIHRRNHPRLSLINARAECLSDAGVQQMRIAPDLITTQQPGSAHCWPRPLHHRRP